MKLGAKTSLNPMPPTVAGLIQFVVRLKTCSRFMIDMSELHMMKVGAPN